MRTSRAAAVLFICGPLAACSAGRMNPPDGGGEMAPDSGPASCVAFDGGPGVSGYAPFTGATGLISLDSFA